jgi:hypothetical protein
MKRISVAALLLSAVAVTMLAVALPLLAAFSPGLAPIPSLMLTRRLHEPREKERDRVPTMTIPL